MMNATNHERIITALWFAIVGFAPAIAAFVTFSDFTIRGYVSFLALPVVLAGIVGYTFGYPILQEAKVKTEKQAVRRGLFASLIAYLLLGLVLILIEGIVISTDPSGLSQDPKLEAMVVLFAIVGVLVFIPIYYFGQFALLLISGALAGWLLFVNKTNLSRLLLVGGSVILIVGGWILWGLPNPHALPIYPSAESVKYGEFEITDSGTAEEKIISFQTEDTFDEVLDYYENRLVRDGWNFAYRTDTILVLDHPTKNFKVRVNENKETQERQIQVRLWHSTFP